MLICTKKKKTISGKIMKSKAKKIKRNFKAQIKFLNSLEENKT